MIITQRVGLALILSLPFLLAGCFHESEGKFEVKMPSKLTVKKEVRHEFFITVRNRSSEEIRVDRITTSCSCLGKNENEFLLGAGESRTLTFEIFSAEPGQHKESIVFITNLEKRFEIVHLSYEVI